jgi:hypothetical protein
MKKTLIMIIFTFTAFLALVQPVSAWAAPTHYAIAEEVYYSLPVDAQDKLDLSKMIDGADDPDFKFFDFQYHHYPASGEKANYWLLKGKFYYQNEDYKQASYCFGWQPITFRIVSVLPILRVVTRVMNTLNVSYKPCSWNLISQIKLEIWIVN